MMPKHQTYEEVGRWMMAEDLQARGYTLRHIAMVMGVRDENTVHNMRTSLKRLREREDIERRKEKQ